MCKEGGELWLSGIPTERTYKNHFERKNFSLQIWVGGVGEAKREGMNCEGEALVSYATWEV